MICLESCVLPRLLENRPSFQSSLLFSGFSSSESREVFASEVREEQIDSVAPISPGHRTSEAQWTVWPTRTNDSAENPFSDDHRRWSQPFRQVRDSIGRVIWTESKKSDAPRVKPADEICRDGAP